MLSSLTWTHFFVFVGCAVVLWSLYVLYLARKSPPANRHSPPEKKIWSNNQQKPGSDKDHSRKGQLGNIVVDPLNENLGTQHGNEEDEANYRALEDLATEISILITAEGIDTTKDQLTVKLQEQIARYPTLQDIAFKIAIGNLVIRAAKKECGVDFSEDEVGRLWPVVG